MFRLAKRHDTDTRANRDAYNDAMLEMMKTDDRIVHIDCGMVHKCNKN